MGAQVPFDVDLIEEAKLAPLGLAKYGMRMVSTAHARLQQVQRQPTPHMACPNPEHPIPDSFSLLPTHSTPCTPHVTYSYSASTGLRGRCSRSATGSQGPCRAGSQQPRNPNLATRVLKSALNGGCRVQPMAKMSVATIFDKSGDT